MIDVVSSVTGGGAQLKQPATSRSPVPSAPPAPVVQASSNGAMRIRVDNQLDMAIIEYRSSETGEIMHQYPTEAQVKAMSRAAELEAFRAATAEAASFVEAGTPLPVADTSVDSDMAVAPEATYAAPPAAAAVAAPAIASAAPVATSPAPDASSSSAPAPTQSITV